MNNKKNGNNIFVKETWTNKTENYICGDSGVYETYTSNKSDLFKSLRKENGKCISKMYIEDKKGNSKCIGWVFEKKVFYEDTHEPYIQETWVELHKRLPKKTIKNYYQEI